MSIHTREEWFDERIAQLVQVFEEGPNDERVWLATGRLLEDFTVLSLAAAADLVDRHELIEAWTDISDQHLPSTNETALTSDARGHVQEWLSADPISRSLKGPTSPVQLVDVQAVEDLLFLRTSHSETTNIVMDPVFAYEAMLLFSTDERWEAFQSPASDDEDSDWSLVDGHLGHLDALDDWCTFYFDIGLTDGTSSHVQHEEESWSFTDVAPSARALAMAVRSSVGIPWVPSDPAGRDPEAIHSLDSAHDAVHRPFDLASLRDEALPIGRSDWARRLRRWAGVYVEGWRRVDRRMASRSPPAAKAIERRIAKLADQLPPSAIPALRRGLRERWSSMGPNPVSLGGHLHE